MVKKKNKESYFLEKSYADICIHRVHQAVDGLGSVMSGSGKESSSSPILKPNWPWTLKIIEWIHPFEPCGTRMGHWLG